MSEGLRRVEEAKGAGLVDLHTHLLPGVDDGVRDMAEAMDQLRDARDQGVEAVVCTPHVHPGPAVGRTRMLEERRRIHDRLVEAAAAEGGLPEVGLGSEVLLLEEPLDLSASGLRINGTSYALVEILFWRERFADLRRTFRKALDRGWRPVLAHVERYARLEPFDDLLALWREDGVLAQVNASSFARQHGDRVRERAWRLLGQGVVDLVASDVHGPHMRLNHLGEAHALVRERAGQGMARRLFVDVPRAIYRGEEVPVGEGTSR